MSSIGLNTNIFRITGKALELLNDFVVKAKINAEVDEGKKEQLIDFISKINDNNNAQPQYQLLSNIIERELRPKIKEIGPYLNSIIEEIKGNDRNDFLPKLEFLAEVLDTESSEALSKIIGD